jgi:putative CocE/NonD family hydrolase
MVTEPPTSAFEPSGFTQPPPSITAEIHSVAYRTSPFADKTEVTGPIALTMYASIDMDDTNFMVDLMDVDPSGKEVSISRGYLKASHRAVEEKRSKPYQPFHPHTDPQPVVPGEVYEYFIELMPVSIIFKPGHSMKLVIRNQDDMLDRLGAWGLCHLPLSKTVSHKIYHDKDHLSFLLIPIIPKTDESQWIGAG